MESLRALDQNVVADLDDRGWPALMEGVTDPNLALSTLARLYDDHPDQTLDLVRSPGAARRLLAVVGGSKALGQHLVQHPEDLAELADEPCARDRDQLVAEVSQVVRGEGELSPRDRLRLANRRALVRIAARDLTHPSPTEIQPEISTELADLADAIMAAALDIASDEVVDHDRVRLAILAMGKCGARELNYISDIDVIFVAEPADDQTTTDQAIQIATKLASAMMRICSGFTQTGSVWQVDAALRPEGNAGQLVRSLASMKAYYEGWAKNWEFQALLKARPMAGDLALGEEFCAMVAPMVWRVAERDGFMAETQAMRKRVVSLLPAKEASREIKLGAGGLRDTEFTVQLLQLVHGKADERLRLRGTLPALAALSEHTYIGRGDAAELADCYRLQRVLEHRVQLFTMRRTHLLPADGDGLRRLARQLGLRSGDEVAQLWKDSARSVQRLHQRVFYSPLLETVAQINAEELRLTPEAARARMVALGFADPEAAMRHIQALTTGVNRAADIQRQLMPAMLGWFAEAPHPDAGLLAFRQMSESLKNSPWYLRALRDEGRMASLLAQILASSRYAVDLLKRNPESVQLLANDDDLAPRPLERLASAMQSTLARHESEAEAANAVRAIRRRELFRVAVADMADVADLDGIGEALTDVASATVGAALQLAQRAIPDAPEVAVVAMGRWGGREMSYASDCDAMFLIDDTDEPEAIKKAEQVVARTRQLLAAPGPDPALEIDVNLRPEGKGGPMVRTLGSYLAYYDRWSDTWEAQALIRAGYGAGPVDLVDRLLDGLSHIRYPEQGIGRAQVTEIRKLKARMETERMPRGVDARQHVKLGPGGLSDVEWSIQLLQLQHAGRLPGLRTTKTLTALDAAREAELITASQASALRTAWTLASEIRNANMLNRARVPDLVPSDARDRGNVCYLLAQPPGSGAELVDSYLKASRRAAAVVDELFWGKR